MNDHGMGGGGRRRRRRRGGRNRHRGGGQGGHWSGGGGQGPGPGPGGYVGDLEHGGYDDGAYPPGFAAVGTALETEVAAPPAAEPFTSPTMEELYGMGVVELAREGHGFLRSPANAYVPFPDDPYVPPAIVRQYGIRDGALLAGDVGQPKRPGQNPPLLRPTCIGGVAPHLYHTLPHWDDLIVIDPEPKIELTRGSNDVTLRIIDMLCPIGFGQRGLLVSPPRAGKTTVLQKIAQAIQTDYPEIFLIVLLVDERPEEATAMRRATTGEVSVSTNDKPPENHVALVEVVIKKARRLVEAGRDVVILMDSLTRLGRAYNLLQRGGGRTLSGGMDARTLEKPKAFFGGARKIENGGSLTILATALIDTGSRLDQVIFEEFKGTGNMELVLDRDLAEQRLWPAIDVNKSGTRKEEKLLKPAFLEKVYLLRRVLNKVQPVQAMDLLIGRLQETATNEEFLTKIAQKRAE
jgi:transcription termination factor Rho